MQLKPVRRKMRIDRMRRAFRLRQRRFELLESRTLLVGDFQNPVLPQDVDNNGLISVSDLTPVLVDLRTFGVPHDLTQPAAPPLTAPPYVDVDGDDVVAINDLLDVVSPLRVSVGLPAPVIEAALVNDTGVAGDGITTDPSIGGQISENLLEETRLLARLDGGAFIPVALGPTGNFTFNPGLPLDGTANGPHSVHLIGQTIGGAVAMATIDFTLEGGLPEGAVVLAEGNQFLVEADELIPLGQSEGSRTLRLQVDADFDASDNSSAVEDTLLVSLVDPNFPSQTILDRGQDGTTLFALSGDAADFPPGLVRFDGHVVEIDLTDTGFYSEGRLLFQLLNLDGDTGSRVVLRVLSNEVDEEGSAALTMPPHEEVVAAGGVLDLSSLGETAEVEPQLSNVRFDSDANCYVAELRVTNNGPALGRQLAVAFPDLPEGVTILNPSGTTTDGDPYLNLLPALPRGGLGRDQTSSPVLLELENPDLARLTLAAKVLAAPNQPPQFDAVANLVVMPGGYLEVPLTATDPDGDPVTFSIQSDVPLPTGKLQAASLVFLPRPGELGDYTFTLAASDGAAETTQEVMLNVVADPVTTTRVSGRILDVDETPLAGMQVEIGAVQGLTQSDGSFTLDLGDGALVSDTIKVRGELFAGPLMYPFIAEKLPLVLEHDVFPGVNNVIGRPIFLPALDVANGKEIDPMQDTLVTTDAIPGASVFVDAGTLMNQQGTPFDGVLSITEVPAELTPAALPANMFPGMVVTIQPGEMVFAAPAPLSLPNRGGAPPGSMLDLWSINPVTGNFDNVGQGRVSFDGQTINTVTGGVRNSSWHFFAPPPPPPAREVLPEEESVPDPGSDPFNEDAACNECKGRTKGNSEVELHSGAVIETHELVAYQTQGESRGVQLVYDSLRADPRPIVHLGVNNVPFQQSGLRSLLARVTIRRGDFAFEVPSGLAVTVSTPTLTGKEHLWGIPQDGGSFKVAVQADLSSSPTGIYSYEINSGVVQVTIDGLAPAKTSYFGTSARTGGTLLHVNSVASPFGAGWGVSGLQTIVEGAAGEALLIDGDSSEQLFSAPPSAGERYGSPPGDFSILEKLPDGRFRRTMKDQTVHQFDAAGRIASITDRNGNQTVYQYDGAGNLAKIVDPVGLEMVFAYTASRLASITDPANRVTQFQYDAAGNLTKVTDPDGSSRTWEYDDRHHMTGETDQLGRQEHMEYNFAGRAARATLKDGSQRMFAPVQTQRLAALTATTYHDQGLGTGARIFATGDVMAMTADGNGNIVASELDQAGQIIREFDSEGALPIVRRNEDNQIVSSTDARGNTTTFAYDDRGNLIRTGDALSNPDNFFGGGVYVTGDRPREFAVGDVTGDGVVDIVVVGAGFFDSIPARLYRGLGDGTFSSPIELETISERVAIGDVNNDGLNDIVVEDGILLNTGGGFELVDEAFGRERLQLVDLNADGALDVVASSNSLIAVRLGNGTGAFAPLQTIAPAAGASDLAIGDVNDDDKLDLVAVNSSTGMASVFEGDGAGNFAAPVSFDVGTGALSVALGDIDGDGDVDIVAATGTSTQNKIVRLLNDGDGQFAAPVTQFTIATPDQRTNSRHVRLADVNDDGFLDAVTARNRYLQGGVSVGLGYGDGNFAAPAFYTNWFYAGFVGANVAQVEAIDLNRDGLLDLVSFDDQENEINVSLNGGFASFDSQLPIAESGSRAAVAAGDLNGDGLTDMVTGGTDGVSIHLARGKGLYSPPVIFPSPTRVEHVYLADLDDDSDLDLMAVNYYGTTQLSLFLNSGEGDFSNRTDLSVLPRMNLAIGDVDLDGDLDLAAVNYGGNLEVKLLLGDGQASFPETQTVPIPAATRLRSVGLGDLDGDGDLDLLVATRGTTYGPVQESMVHVAFNQIQNMPEGPVSSFTDGGAFPVGGGSFGDARKILVADLDDDTDLDVATLNYWRGNVSVLLNQGIGSFGPATQTRVGSFPHGMDLGDVDGDDLPELATVNRDNGDVTVFPNLGGVFGPGRTYSQIPKPRAIEFADFDDDGDLDFATVAEYGDRPTIIRLNRDGGFGPSELATGTRIFDFAVADVNRDGAPDVVAVGPQHLAALLTDRQGNVSETHFNSSVTPSGQSAIAIGDLNGDQNPDAVVLASNNLVPLLGDGAGEFTAGTGLALGSNNVPDVQLGDMNGDGFLDAVIANRGLTAISIFPGDGNGGFGQRRDITSTAGPVALALADLDLDGDLDVATANNFYTNTVSVLLNDGNANFPFKFGMATGGDSRPTGVKVGDFNRDGLPDIVASNSWSSDFSSNRSGTASVFLGIGGGNFGPLATYNTGVFSEAMDVGDINGDGILDMYFTGGAILLGRGDGTFQERRSSPDDFRFRVVLADLDQDGDLDALSSIRYDSSGITVRKNTVAQTGRRYAYDPVFNRQTSAVDELGRTTLSAVDPANGNTLSVTRVVGEVGGGDDVVTRFTYTAPGLVETETDPLGRVTRYGYDNRGRLTSIVYAEGTADEAMRRFEHDAAGNRTAEIDENGHRTEFEYDAMNRLAKATAADPDGAGPLTSPVSTFVYDAAGNQTSSTDAAGSETTFVYDGRDRLVQSIDEQGHIQRLTYDNAGNLISTVDPLGAETQRIYDARNRLERIIDPDGGVTRFQYDPDNNLISLTDPVGNVTRFQYDARNRLVRETDPLGEAMRYDYDLVDNLVEKTDRVGRITQFEYDDLDRAIEETWLNADGSSANLIASVYDALGNLTSLRDGFSQLAFTYDNRNRAKIVSNAGTPGAPEVLLTYDYDAAGNVVSVADAIGGAAAGLTEYQYDALNRTTRVQQSGAGVAEKRVDLAYNGLGQYTRLDRFSDLAGTQPVVFTQYQYDTLNRLTRLAHNDGAADIAFYNYTYDDDSRISSIEDIDGLTTYAYDDRDQLTGADHADADNPDEQYNYDANGNRISSHLHAADYVTGAGNRLLSDGTYNYEYDSEGNLINRTEIASDRVREFQWDHRNRLTGVIEKDAGGGVLQDVQFTYDAMNRRIAKAVDTAPNDAVDAAVIRFIYDREDVILDLVDADGSGPDSATVEARYLHGAAIDQVFAVDDRQNNAQWLLPDHLGTIRDITDTAGAVIEHIVYDSFGKTVSPAMGMIHSRYLFAGREFDSEIDLYYNRQRYFDSSLGAFLSEDPIGVGSGDDNNRRYVYNAPLTMTDPFGADAIYVEYQGYPIKTPIGTLPLGHSAVIGINATTGATAYYEFGRYYGNDNGIVRRCTIPDVALGSNGQPTQASLQNLYDYISKNYGKGHTVDPKYRADTDYEKVSEYAKDFSKNHSPYGPLSNNCKTFANDASQAGNENFTPVPPTRPRPQPGNPSPGCRGI